MVSASRSWTDQKQPHEHSRSALRLREAWDSRVEEGSLGKGNWRNHFKLSQGPASSFEGISPHFPMSTNSPKVGINQSCAHVEGEHANTHTTLLEHSAGALEYEIPETTLAPLTIKLCKEATRWDDELLWLSLGLTEEAFPAGKSLHKQPDGLKENVAFYINSRGSLGLCIREQHGSKRIDLEQEGILLRTQHPDFVHSRACALGWSLGLKAPEGQVLLKYTCLFSVIW